MSVIKDHSSSHFKDSGKGHLYGVGVGPGDPELITLKALRLIQNCDVVTYLRSDAGNSMARDIAAEAMAMDSEPTREEQAIIMPMSPMRDVANAAYDVGAKMIAAHLDSGKDVVFLCQGDAFFFGSFAHLHDRLNTDYAITIVPGVTSINTAASLIEKPLGLLAENVAIISGRRNDESILKTLQEFDNVAIMKPGNRRPQILDLIEQAGRVEDTSYIEYASQENQRIVKDIRSLDKTAGPYFSLFLVNRSRNYSNAS